MTRNRLHHAWIENDVKRRTTFKKRRKGLFKKVSELTTLCDVEACVVIYGPHDAEPEVWPNMPEAAMMVQTFLELPQMVQCKKMTDQETYLESKFNKMCEQYQKLASDTHELEKRALVYDLLCGRDLNELSEEDARNVFYTAGMKEKQAYDLMQTIKRVNGNPENLMDDAIERLPSDQDFNELASLQPDNMGNNLDQPFGSSVSDQTIFQNMEDENLWISPYIFGSI